MILSDATIIITGGAKGIGNYLANDLYKNAKKVIVVDNDKISLNVLKEENKFQCYQCDLTDPEETGKVMKQIFEECGEVNVLINNAGFISSEPLLNLLKRPDPKHSIENWKKTIDINLNSVFYAGANFAECFHSKRIKNGLIINISSIAAQGNLGQSAYSAAKAGVEALTKTWSKELAMFKIRCAAIAPGFFATDSTRASLSENVLNKWEQAVPVKRLGELSEVASAIKFIIENDYFNGKILSLDGGLNI